MAFFFCFGFVFLFFTLSLFSLGFLKLSSQIQSVLLLSTLINYSCTRVPVCVVLSNQVVETFQSIINLRILVGLPEFSNCTHQKHFLAPPPSLAWDKKSRGIWTWLVAFPAGAAEWFSLEGRLLLRKFPEHISVWFISPECISKRLSSFSYL